MNPAELNVDSVNNALSFIQTQGMEWGLKLVAAIATWIIGRWIIKHIVKLIGRAAQNGKHNIDKTLFNYMSSIVSWLLTLLLILIIMGIVGIQTTSFAAILAGAGLAVGTAWGGLLTHFAAGVFLQLIRPFKVGDSISGGGVTGTVREIGVFATTITTAGNVETIVPNNKLFSDNIQNFSALRNRSIENIISFPLNTDVPQTIEELKQAIMQVSGVSADFPPTVSVAECTAFSLKLKITSYAPNEKYGQVVSDVNQAIGKYLLSTKTA